MRTVFREFWHSAQLWVFITCSLVTLAILLTVGFWLQRADTQRQIDRSALMSVEQVDRRVKAAIAELRAQDAKSSHDRLEIKKTVDELKEQIKSDGANR